jgi:hypothetical protein
MLLFIEKENRNTVNPLALDHIQTTRQDYDLTTLARNC